MLSQCRVACVMPAGQAMRITLSRACISCVFLYAKTATKVPTMESWAQVHLECDEEDGAFRPQRHNYQTLAQPMSLLL